MNDLFESDPMNELTLGIKKKSEAVKVKFANHIGIEGVVRETDSNSNGSIDFSLSLSFAFPVCVCNLYEFCTILFDWKLSLEDIVLIVTEWNWKRNPFETDKCNES